MWSDQKRVNPVLKSSAPADLAQIFEPIRADLDAVEEAQGRFTEAAKALGLHPNYLHRLIRNLDLRAEINSRVERADRS